MANLEVSYEFGFMNISQIIRSRIGSQVWRMLLGISAAAVLGPTRCGGADIGLTLSPASITNDYVGKVTANITSLTPGMTVTVELYADLNTNGVIDAGDLLVQSFQLTDGQVPLVAGVRNLNVPGDEDGLVNGQIQAVVYFPSAGGFGAIGKSLVRVSDPSGSLGSVTQAFSVAQKFYPQGITGRLTWAGTGLPVTNSPLGLRGLTGTIASYTLTDSNGNYSFYCLPGYYGFEGLNDKGAIYNVALSVSVGCGQMVTNNFAVTNGAFWIAGQVTDSGTGLGIPAMSVDASSTNSLDVLTLTDASGNYALQVTPNTWGVHPSTGGPSAAGYLDPKRTNVVITARSVSNFNFSLSKPTALIYGTIKDTLNNPVVGVQVSARDEPTNAFHILGRSFVTNASYTIGVQAGTWGPTPDSGDLGLRGFLGYGSNVTLVTGRATNLDFIVTRTNWPSLQPPLRLTSSQFQFLLSGLAGQNYTIQSSTDVGGSNWLVVMFTNAPCDSVLIADPDATNSARFYRVLVGP